MDRTAFSFGKWSLPSTSSPSSSSSTSSSSSSSSRAGLLLNHKTSPSAILKWLLLALALPITSGEKTVTATAASSSCSYTVVINEFDVSKCSAMQGHIQSDGVGLTPEASAAGRAKVKMSKVKSSFADSPFYSRKASEDKPQGGNDQAPTLDTQLQDVEAKLLEEMVRSREINSTLNRHARLLSTAQHTLEMYRTNFTRVFRTMMKMERTLHHQRRINRSLNKKLSNVILDVVEVNNVISKKMTSSSEAKSPKKFNVESVGKITSCPGISDQSKVYKDCASVYDAGHHRSDVYFIKPLYAACPIPVFCDMDSPKGGWLLIQRRRDGSVDFRRKWHEYRDGFGDVRGEHWLGNDNIFLLTNQDRYQLRVDLWDFSGNRVYALYSTFKIEGERDDYRLHISGYGGSAQDALHRHNNIKFSTVDRDHDNRREANCADEWEAGWWFDKCWVALLNGPYQNQSEVQWKGLAWNSWKREQLRASEMKIRPMYRRRH